MVNIDMHVLHAEVSSRCIFSSDVRDLSLGAYEQSIQVRTGLASPHYVPRLAQLPSWARRCA